MLVVHGPLKLSKASGKHMNDAALKINRKESEGGTNHSSSVIL